MKQGGSIDFFFPQRCGVKDICLSVQVYVIILNTRRPAKVQLLWETDEPFLGFFLNETAGDPVEYFNPQWAL